MKRLLIADDSQAKIDLMVAMLSKAGWRGEAVVAMTTEQAKELIDEDAGYAFIDYYIPSENGPAVIAHLKEKNPSARIALVSSADTQTNFDEAREAGAEECICTTWESDRVESAFMSLLKDWISS